MIYAGENSISITHSFYALYANNTQNWTMMSGDIKFQNTQRCKDELIYCVTNAEKIVLLKCVKKCTRLYKIKNWDIQKELNM
jgi:hypothetical protein